MSNKIFRKSYADFEQRMIQLCAEAMGQDKGDSVPPLIYNPFTDRAQAMELVEKFSLQIEPDVTDSRKKLWTVTCKAPYHPAISTTSAELLRSITLCVAEMWIEKRVWARQSTDKKGGS